MEYPYEIILNKEKSDICSLELSAKIILSDFPIYQQSSTGDCYFNGKENIYNNLSYLPCCKKNYDKPVSFDNDEPPICIPPVTPTLLYEPLIFYLTCIYIIYLFSI